MRMYLEYNLSEVDASKRGAQWGGCAPKVLVNDSVYRGWIVVQHVLPDVYSYIQAVHIAVSR